MYLSKILKLYEQTKFLLLFSYTNDSMIWQNIIYHKYNGINDYYSYFLTFI